jgi:hypothetical protein
VRADTQVEPRLSSDQPPAGHSSVDALLPGHEREAQAVAVGVDAGEVEREIALSLGARRRGGQGWTTNSIASDRLVVWFEVESGSRYQSWAQARKWH